jgi:hypothetical protein
MLFKDNLLVIRMGVAGLTQWGSKLAEGKALREGWHSKELWKGVEKAKAEGEQPVRHL